MPRECTCPTCGRPLNDHGLSDAQWFEIMDAVAGLVRFARRLGLADAEIIDIIADQLTSE
jgi:hypothetical protein